MEKLISFIISAAVMASSNAVCNIDRAPSDAPETDAPITETAEPTEAAQIAEYPIEYDDTAESRCHYMRDFAITSIEKNAEGNYDITYTLRTFLEGRGDVSVSFRCLDENGAEVDSFGGMFRGTDYTWSWHTAQASISGKTAKIELID